MAGEPPGQFDALMKSFDADLRALAADLRVAPASPAQAMESPGNPLRLSPETRSAVRRRGAPGRPWSSMEELPARPETAPRPPLLSDHMSMQAEVGTQGSRRSDAEAEAEAVAALGLGHVALRELQEGPGASPRSSGDPGNVGSDTELPEPTAPPLEEEASADLGDPAEAADAEERGIFKVLAYKLQDMQRRNLQAMMAEVTVSEQMFLDRIRTEREDRQRTHAVEVEALRREHAAMREELATAEEERDTLRLRLALRSEKMGALGLRVQRKLTGDFSLLNCFRRLQKHARAAQHRGRLGEVSRKLFGYREAARAFARLRHYADTERRRRSDQEAKLRLQEVCRGVMQRYEEELKGLRAELAVAKEEAVVGLRRRRQLEESLRTTLMRGMTGMQLEALNLFRETAEAEREERVLRSSAGSDLGRTLDAMTGAKGSEAQGGQDATTPPRSVRGMAARSPRVVAGEGRPEGRRGASRTHAGRGQRGRGVLVGGEAPRPRAPKPTFR